MERRVIVQWTTTARDQLAKLPPKARKGLLAKADLLRKTDDPTAPHKALTGPLSGCYRITYGRYRAVYTVTEDAVDEMTVLIHVRVRFIVAGIRKARDKKDIYDVAKRLVQYGLDDLDDATGEVEKPGSPPEVSD